MKKIAIFGSTGSIGTSLLDIIKKNKKDFKIELLTAHKDYKKLLKQAKFFNVKNIIITDNNSFLIASKLLKNNKIKVYKDFDSIVSELKKVKEYNIRNKRWGFLHPSASSIMDPAEEFNIDIMNKKDLDRKAFKPCKAPWQSVHINTDGNVFPCMAIPMGNIREGYDRVFNGQRFKEFRDIIRNEGLVEGCNRCGWLKPNR